MVACEVASFVAIEVDAVVVAAGAAAGVIVVVVVIVVGIAAGGSVRWDRRLQS